ncbi:hypothetical protein D6810_03360 [Candidatus Dojkabacteria bacterium]|uniref:Uncharacterized protein n=1 Tax=Candidatus Dojkabacteria bacterium TaxID=2099670 RepID=A0A3M0YXZ3_9BACT|nr:MAG: hypothetical protein D6810_03360 [Candidatus Dojkabacteria bacterium]
MTDSEYVDIIQSVLDKLMRTNEVKELIDFIIYSLGLQRERDDITEFIRDVLKREVASAVFFQTHPGSISGPSLKVRFPLSCEDCESLDRNYDSSGKITYVYIPGGQPGSSERRIEVFSPQASFNPKAVIKHDETKRGIQFPFLLELFRVEGRRVLVAFITGRCPARVYFHPEG